MDVLAKLEIIEHLKNLKGRYFYHLDAKDWKGWREVFCDDVVMDVSAHFADAPDPSIYIMRGGDFVVQSVSAQLGETATAHHGHTPLFDVQSDDQASGIWSMEDNLFLSDGSRIDGFGHYHEEYRRRDGVWRIWRSRLTRIKLIFSPPPAVAV